MSRFLKANDVPTSLFERFAFTTPWNKVAKTGSRVYNCFNSFQCCGFLFYPLIGVHDIFQVSLSAK